MVIMKCRPTLLPAISLFVLGVVSFPCLILGDYTEQEGDIWPILTYFPPFFCEMILSRFSCLSFIYFFMLVLCTIIEIWGGSRERPGLSKLTIISWNIILKAKCVWRNASLFILPQLYFTQENVCMQQYCVFWNV